MNLQEFILKLQSLSDSQKKAIVIGAVCVASFMLGFWWVRVSVQRLSNLGQINMPDVNLSQTVTPGK